MTDQREKSDFNEESHFEEWARKTALFREWAEIKEDILRHKWFESEKAGHDIGWDRAFVDYNLKIRRAPKREKAEGRGHP
jgi:hypothetical protein